VSKRPDDSRRSEELADELGISTATLRAWLRRIDPGRARKRQGRWDLSAEQVSAARRRWGKARRSGETPPPARRSSGRPPASPRAGGGGGRRASGNGSGYRGGGNGWNGNDDGPRPSRRGNGGNGRGGPRLPLARRRRRRRGGRRNTRRWIFLPLLVFLILVGVVAAAIGTVATVAQPVVESTCDLSELRPITLGQNSFVYAGNGSLLGAIPSEKDRQPITLKQMSPWVPKATVAIEDRRFYRHGALDYQGIIQAAIADLTAGHVVQGGSTLTQQLVRYFYIGCDHKSLSSKIKEACLSLRLAQQWSK